MMLQEICLKDSINRKKSRADRAIKKLEELGFKNYWDYNLGDTKAFKNSVKIALKKERQ